MNALDIQHLLVTEHNKLAGMPLTEGTLLTFKENIKNHVRRYTEIFDVTHITQLEEWEHNHLLASSSAVEYIFYCLCLSWVPRINIISDENGQTIKTITKDDLLSNEMSLVVLGLIALFIKDGKVYVKRA